MLSWGPATGASSCLKQPSRGSARSVLVAVLLIAAFCHAHSDVQPTAAEERLVQWVLDNGGTTHVKIAMINNAYRGLVTKDMIPKGGLLAAIPEHLSFPIVDTDINYNRDGFADQRGAVAISLDMANSSSRWATMWASYPPAEDLACCAHQLPREYAPLLQHKLLERYHREMQQKTEDFATRYAQKLQRDGITLEQLSYAMSMLHTRNFQYYNITRFIPFLDMANFRPLTPNQHQIVAPCPLKPEVNCTLWIAGEDLQAGEEAHVAYGGMWNDRSLLQYGFLQEPQPGEQPPLIGVDRHDFSTRGPLWSSNNAFTQSASAFSADSAEGYGAEVARLQQILQSLVAFEPAVGVWPVSRKDKDGYCLKTLRRFRELRRQALEAEIARLQVLEAKAAAGQLPAGPIEAALVLAPPAEEAGGRLHGAGSSCAAADNSGFCSLSRMA